MIFILYFYIIILYNYDNKEVYMKGINLNYISPADVQINIFTQFINSQPAIIYIINIFLAIFSIILVIFTFYKKYNLKHFSKWILLFIISVFINAIPDIIFDYSLSLDSNPTFNKYVAIIFSLITLFIRLILIAYPIITIKKNKQHNAK